MMSDLPGPRSSRSADGACAGETSRPEAAAVRFESILFERPGAGPGTGGPQRPEFFADLNLDQVLKSMTAGREQYDLEPLFCTPLHEADAVRYRHEVLRDLETREVLDPVNRFAEAMRRMRRHLEQAQKLHYKLQKQAWFLDAGDIYCTAVRVLAREFAACEVSSGGFHGFRRYLGEYAGIRGLRLAGHADAGAEGGVRAGPVRRADSRRTGHGQPLRG